MYIATIDYYDHENDHRKTTVDPRLLFKLIRSVKGGTCRCKWKNTIWRAFKGSYHLVPRNAHQLRFTVAYNTPLVRLGRVSGCATRAARSGTTSASGTCS